MSIVVSPALVIIPASSVPAHYPKVGWHNLVTFSNVTADSEADGYPITNVANPNTSQRWVSGSTAEQLVTIGDLEGQPDYIGLARHNLGSGQCEVAVEGITGEPGAVWEELLSATLTSDRPAILQFAADYYTDLRLRLTPGAVEPSIAVIYVGSLLQFAKGLQTDFVPINRAREVETVLGRSESGEFLGAIITGASLASTAQFHLLDPDWYEENAEAFVVAANSLQPFFFAWNPSGKPDDVAFCWLTQSAKPPIVMFNGLLDLTLNMGGLAL